MSAGSHSLLNKLLESIHSRNSSGEDRASKRCGFSKQPFSAIHSLHGYWAQHLHSPSAARFIADSEASECS